MKLTPDVMLHYYNNIFTDSTGESKVRKWLMKKGITGLDIDDLEGIMLDEFISGIEEYTYDHIKFEIFIWQKFIYALLCWFQKQKYLSSVYVKGEILEKDMPSCEVDGLDVEEILSLMTVDQRMIVRIKMNNGWNKHEIAEYLGLNSKEYSQQMEVIKKIVNNCI